MYWKSSNFHRTWNMTPSFRNWTRVGIFGRTRGVEQASQPIAAIGKWSTTNSPWPEDTNSLLCRGDNGADHDHPEHQCEELSAQGGLCHSHGLVHRRLLRLRLLRAHRVRHRQLLHQERLRLGWQECRSWKGKYGLVSIPNHHPLPCWPLCGRGLAH